MMKCPASAENMLKCSLGRPFSGQNVVKCPPPPASYIDGDTVPHKLPYMLEILLSSIGL